MQGRVSRREGGMNQKGDKVKGRLTKCKGRVGRGRGRVQEQGNRRKEGIV